MRYLFIPGMSHRPGAIITRHDGRQYQVQPDGSIVRIGVRRRKK